MLNSSLLDLIPPNKQFLYCIHSITKKFTKISFIWRWKVFHILFSVSNTGRMLGFDLKYRFCFPRGRFRRVSTLSSVSSHADIILKIAFSNFINFFRPTFKYGSPNLASSYSFKYSSHNSVDSPPNSSKNLIDYKRNKAKEIGGRI